MAKGLEVFRITGFTAEADRDYVVNFCGDCSTGFRASVVLLAMGGRALTEGAAVGKYVRRSSELPRSESFTPEF